MLRRLKILYEYFALLTSLALLGVICLTWSVFALPLYFIAVGVSWALCGNIGAWNAFERQAGLADGGYPQRPLRPALARALSVLRPTARRSPAAGPGSPPAPEPGGPAGSTASPSR